MEYLLKTRSFSIECGEVTFSKRIED